jgi:hypothetical protein
MSLLSLALALLVAPAQDGGDWATWRGPHGNGIAAPGQDLPLEWSETENVLWKAAIRGRGHSSPTVVGDRIILATADADRQVQSVLAFERATGKPAWTTDLHAGGFPRKIHPNNSHATCTVASDGERLFASFFNSEAVHLAALDLAGRKLWQKTVAPLQPKDYQHGYASSPTLYKSLVIAVVDCDQGSFLAAFDAGTGAERWRTPRPAMTSFCSPVVARLSGRDQVLLSGCEQVASYDPETGKALWSCEATTKVTSGTPVWDGDLVFASGGFPKPGTFCVRSDGVVWKNPKKCYEQSMLAHDGHLYAVDDTGIAYCWKGSDGTEMWSARLPARAVASPVLAGGHVYVSNVQGTTVVFAATPKEFREIARNRLGDDTFATPSICGGRIYLRVGHAVDGRRQESLYCIGKR